MSDRSNSQRAVSYKVQGPGPSSKASLDYDRMLVDVQTAEVSMLHCNVGCYFSIPVENARHVGF